jgi:hypothetical protein
MQHPRSSQMQTRNCVWLLSLFYRAQNRCESRLKNPTEISQNFRLSWSADFPPLLGGGLEPHFRVLFFAVFRVFPWGISIRVENSGKEWKKNCSQF